MTECVMAGRASLRVIVIQRTHSGPFRIYDLPTLQRRFKYMHPVDVHARKLELMQLYMYDVCICIPLVSRLALALICVSLNVPNYLSLEDLKLEEY